VEDARSDQNDKTAGIVIIGNEVLSGKVQDTNSPFLLRELYEQGVRVLRVVTIPDDVPTIADEVRAASARFDFVLTSGGVGPTHDDLTFEGIARAFDVPLREDPTLKALLERHFAGRLTPAALRMAMVPSGTRLVRGGDMRYPLCVVRNVYVFPGVPEILRAKFQVVRHELQGTPFLQVRIFTQQKETALAASLEATLDRVPGVTIGSYPSYDTREYRVMLTLESHDAHQLQEARDILLSLLDGSQVVGVDDPSEITRTPGEP